MIYLYYMHLLWYWPGQSLAYNYMHAASCNRTNLSFIKSTFSPGYMAKDDTRIIGNKRSAKRSILNRTEGIITDRSWLKPNQRYYHCLFPYSVITIIQPISTSSKPFDLSCLLVPRIWAEPCGIWYQATIFI